MRRYRREISVAVVYACLLVLLAVQGPRFYSGSQLGNIFVQCAPVLVADVGMTLVILARQIDISIGAAFSVRVCAGLLAQARLPMPLVVAATMGSRELRPVNGFFVAVLGFRPSWSSGHHGDFQGRLALVAAGRICPRLTTELSVVRSERFGWFNHHGAWPGPVAHRVDGAGRVCLFAWG